MSLKINDKQKLAIENIDKNIVVNAGAGTGKTTVLVQRYLRILEDGKLNKNEEVQSIVAITFTKKAAGEMLDRIRDEISKKMGQAEKWEAYYRDLEKANISTIHSFCGNIIRENTIELGLDPKFQILDENVSDNLLEKAIKNYVNQEIEKNDDFLNLLLDLNLFTLDKIVLELKSLYFKIRNNGFKLGQIRESLTENLSNLELNEALISDILIEVDELLKVSRANSKIYKFSQTEDFQKLMDKSLDGAVFLEVIKDLAENLGTNKSYQENIDKIQLGINKLLLVKEKENLDNYLMILETMEKIDTIYTKEKYKLSGLDYEDLQIRVNELLDDDYYRTLYQNKYRYLMVDEFQDTNELQKEIFYKLASKDKVLDRKNLFIVGDPKQSIYGFRGGDLEVFYDVVRDIENYDDNNILKLDENYRTNENILNFINYLFSELMDDKYIPLIAKKDDEESFEIEVISNENLEYNQDEEKSYQDRNYEAKFIADRIEDLTRDKKFKYKDVVLLFRAGTRTSIYEEALKEYGIPYYNLTNNSFINSEEIVDLVNAVKAFLNLDDFISNLGFLRSPMVGFSDDEIFLLMKEEGNILRKLELLVGKSYSEIDNELILNTFKLYDYMINNKVNMDSYEFLNEILTKTRYKELVLLTRNGRQKYANIEKFENLILEYETGLLEEFYHIISYIEELENRKISEASIISEDANVVRIMTIHKSKGLEFPVVIIPEISIKNQSIREKILYGKEDGLGIDSSLSKVLFQNIKEKLSSHDKAEEIRVLYVAMTRAEKLLIIGNQGREFGDKNGVTSYLSQDKCKYINTFTGKERKPDELAYIDENLNLNGNNKPKNLLEFQDYNSLDVSRFSITEYLNFKECKRMFYLDRFYKLSSKIRLLESSLDLEETEYVISPLDKGNIVHRFCELYRANMDSLDLVRKISKNFGYKYEEIESEIRVYIENFIDKTDENYEKIYREQGFFIQLEHGSLSGVIDRININEDYLEIIDYKTNKVKSKKYLEKTYEEQLLFYAYVLKRILNKSVDGAKLFLLETGEYVNIDLRKDKVADTIENINLFMSFVRENKDIENYEKNHACKEYCRYYNYCNKKTL